MTERRYMTRSGSLRPAERGKRRFFLMVITHAVTTTNRDLRFAYYCLEAIEQNRVRVPFEKTRVKDNCRANAGLNRFGHDFFHPMGSHGKNGHVRREW